MSRTILAFLAAMLMAGNACAQGAPAPATHPGTRLSFPPTVGGAQFQTSTIAAQGRNSTYAYFYSLNRMQLSVAIFDGGRRVPAGSENPVVVGQFANEISQVEQQAKFVGQGKVERPSVPSTCSYGGTTYRCIVYSAKDENDRLFSKMLLTGFRDFFVRIRIDWSQKAGQSTADAERALQAFVPALMR
jgi:hypothetical protein